jgi:large subunit ribosomal protein L20
MKERNKFLLLIALFLAAYFIPFGHPRVKSGPVTRRRHKKVLKLARGYRGAKSKVYRIANQQVMKSLNYAYIHRRLRKRDFRKLWITRINAAARNHGLSYSKFMNGLKKAGVGVNRKMLAELAVNNDAAFGELVELAKQNL